jgi:hypothetical protein
MITQYAIEVTQQDIDKGRPNTSSACPVGLAVARATGQSVMVNENQAVMGGEIAYMPRPATVFVLDFDCGMYVQPFSFTLEFEPI